VELEATSLLQEMPSPSPMSSTGKRKRWDLDLDEELLPPSTPNSRRKGSSDFLRKGQWTSTEERLTRLLIEAFEDGYLPIYTGIRLRGYLAVQLQCDPMRVSKKLCAGTIDGKQVPKNYGQKKFKLRKKPFWDCDEAETRITELERLTKALWTEARMRKPSFLTLSSTRNVSKKSGSDGEEELSPVKSSKSKKQKVFPIIYLNLSKLKHYKVRGLDDSSGSDTSPSRDSDSDSEPVRLDGESLQAAYDLLTLCSPRSTTDKGKKSKAKKTSKKASAKTSAVKKDPPINESSSTDVVEKEPITSEKPSEEKVVPDEHTINTLGNTSEDTPSDETPKDDPSPNTCSKTCSKEILSMKTLDEGVVAKGESTEDKLATETPSQDDPIKSEPCPSPSVSSALLVSPSQSM